MSPEIARLIEDALAEFDEFARAIDPLLERPRTQVGNVAEFRKMAGLVSLAETHEYLLIRARLRLRFTVGEQPRSQFAN